jgi:hypothetical protein
MYSWNLHVVRQSHDADECGLDLLQLCLFLPFIALC